MEDLVELNRRIARYFMGGLDSAIDEYLTFVPGCVARLRPKASEIHAFASGARSGQENQLPVVYLNRDYLNLSRLVSKEIHHRPEGLILLGITLEHSNVLAGLSNDQVTRVAVNYPGVMVEFDPEHVRRGAALHNSAGRHHASACGLSIARTH